MGEEKENPSIRIPDFPQENQSTIVQFLKSLSVIGQWLGDLGPVLAIIAFLWRTFGTLGIIFPGLQTSDSQKSGHETMSSPSPQQPEGSSRGKRKAGTHENRRSAKSKSSPGMQSDSGASSSYDSDASGSDSNKTPSKTLALGETLQQVPENVGQSITTFQALPGAIDTIVVVSGPKGSRSVGRTTQNEDRGADTMKLVSASPGQGGKDGGKALGEILNHSVCSGDTIVGVGPGAADEALRLHQLLKGMSGGQVPHAGTTQSPESTNENTKFSPRKGKESKKECPSISDVQKDRATLTGQLCTGPTEQGRVTVVVSTGPVTTDGIVYNEGVNVEDQTNVLVKINPGPTRSANGIKVKNRVGNFKNNLNVMITDHGNAEEAMKKFDDPFFSKSKKKKCN